MDRKTLKRINDLKEERKNLESVYIPNLKAEFGGTYDGASQREISDEIEQAYDRIEQIDEMIEQLETDSL